MIRWCEHRVGGGVAPPPPVPPRLKASLNGCLPLHHPGRAGASTSKAEIYPRIWEAVFADETELTPYMYKKPGKGDSAPGKPLFNDLEGDYDKTDGGQVKGIGRLRLAFDKYVDELAKREEFKGLGSNTPSRVEALKDDVVAKMLWQLDRNLNKFYVGNDADYFIHKDLKGFRTRENNRFIKQVVFLDLDALLYAGEDNTTILIARAFNIVADKLIEFLAAIEEFQKGLFELKKKVVDTHYLISVGKIPAHFYARVFANEAQLAEWKDIFKVEVGQAEDLSEHPTLVVDTSLYAESDPDFQDDLLSLPEFDDLDEQTDGLLINSENWQALNLLQEKFRERIKCIYIDPPYNTGGDGFLYKDSFRHSSWCSMYYDRVSVSKEFLSQDGFVISSIDDVEFYRNTASLEEIFGDANFVASLVWDRNRKGDAKLFSVGHEYMLVYAKNKKFLDVTGCRLREKKAGIDKVKRLWSRWVQKSNGCEGEMREIWCGYVKSQKDPEVKSTLAKYPKVSIERGPYRDDGNINWPGKGGPYYEVLHPKTKKPVKLPKSGWRYAAPETFWEKYAAGYIKFGDDETTVPGVIYYMLESDSQVMGSVFWSYAQTTMNEFEKLFPGKVFDNPKDRQDLSRLINYVTRGSGVILDFFGGSGTTADAVLELKRGGSNDFSFVLVEMGNHYKTIVIPRVKKVLYSSNWNSGEPIDADGSVGIIRCCRFEQYEDLLDNLVVSWDQQALPQNVPLKYLFRPEQNALTASLDVSRPFSQSIRVGKKRELKTIDLMETWLYLQGYWVKSRRMYREFDRPYLAVETTQGALVVFRDIVDGEDDSQALNAILAKYADVDGVSRIQRLELNHDGDLRRLDIETVLIRAEDFMRGAEWN